MGATRLAEIPDKPQIETRMFIGDQLVHASDGGTFETVYPATGEVLCEIPSATKDDVDRAVAAARLAFEKGPWPRMSVEQRAGILRKFGEILLAEAPELLRLNTLDCGKTITQSQFDIGMAGGLISTPANAGYLRGETMPWDPNLVRYSVREPVGVVAGILPFNVPMAFAMGKSAPALATGNVIILKPSPMASLIPIKFVEIGNRAGLPPGVLQIVTGGNEVSSWLAGHPDVDMITLTGSVGAGTAMMQLAAPTIKKVHLELGGKSANIVFADADLPLAAKAAIQGIFQDAGQRCFSGTRLVVEKSVYDEFTSAVATLATRIRTGDPFDPTMRMGSLIHQRQQQSVDGYVQRALAQGATALTGARAPEGFEDGAYYLPTVLVDVKNSFEVAQEELFGPVISAIPFDDEDEALAIANDSKFGLAGGVWTNDLNRAMRMIRGVRTGYFWVNTYAALAAGGLPFGGYKQSGIGRENGMHGLEEYTAVKSIIQDVTGNTVTWGKQAGGPPPGVGGPGAGGPPPGVGGPGAGGPPPGVGGPPPGVGGPGAGGPPPGVMGGGRPA